MNSNKGSSFSRRQAIQLFGVTAATGVLAACAGPGSTGGPAPAATGPTPPATGKPEGDVSFSHWRGEDSDAFEELIKRFQDQYPDVKVAQDISTSNDYNQFALQRVRDGSRGDALACFRGSQFDAFTDVGVFTDLTDTGIVEKYEPALITAGAKDGMQLSLPLQLLLLMPIMNEDAFDKAGADPAPADWDGFLNACDKLKASGISPICWPGGDLGNSAQIFSSMVLYNAPSEDVIPRIQSGEIRLGDDWFQSVLAKYQDIAPYLQPNFEGTSYDSSVQLFASGGAAILATGSYSIATVRSVGGTFPIDMIFPNTMGPDGEWEGVHNATFMIGVNAASDVQPGAFAWIDFLSDPENAGYYANQTAQHVSVKGVKYENPDLDHISYWLSKNTSLSKRHEFTNLDISNAIYTACIKVAGGTSPEQAAEEAQTIIDQQQ
jgi:raffinose/stachyose/melibiose transport system substrate-binding protein